MESPISIDNIHINKKVVSNKVSFSKEDWKYFIGYKDAKKVRPLYIVLPKMSRYKRDFDKIKCIFFMIKDEKLLEKYNELEKKTATLSKKNLIVDLYTMKII